MTYATGHVELGDLLDCSVSCRTHIENIHRALWGVVVMEIVPGVTERTYRA